MPEHTAKNPHGQSCESCRYSIRFIDLMGEEATLEQRLKDDRRVCRYNPPSVTYIFAGMDQNRQPLILARSGFPTIGAAGWCAKYDPAISLQVN
jgi:hypothetical protein